MATYTISELAREFGLTPRTIRFYEDEGILMITAASTSPDITARGYELIFRTIGLDSLQGPTAGKYIVEQVKPSKVAVIHDKQQYGEGIATAVHDLSDNPPQLANIFALCDKLGTQDSVLQFASTSKITHAGSGVAFMGASANNLKGFQKVLGFLTIGPDKVNQLRHVKFFAAPGRTVRLRIHGDNLVAAFKQGL